MRRAILGGTFDPPHIAHLFAGEAAYRQLGVDIVTFVPAGDPWQKVGRTVTEAHHRWEMTRLAVEGVDYFEADRREVDRRGWTFTIDTLETFPDDEELILILGSDAAYGLPSWHRSSDVLARAAIAVMPRPDSPMGQVDAAVSGARIITLDTPQLRLSGTELRRRAHDGHSLRFLVREGVWRYIEAERLYVSDPAE